MKNKLFSLLVLLITATVNAQDVKIPSSTTAHPRLMTNVEVKQSLQTLLASDKNAREAYEQSRQSIETYVNRHLTDSSWIVSRLQMYWNTKSTDIFIKGGVYDHAEGQAPVPTVRFPGTRDNVSIYTAPKLDSLLPYMDDPRGVYLVNKTKPGQPMEWTEIAKTGRILEAINTQIMQMANTAAMLYWLNKEEKYARFAFDLFDTYMTGMYYRKLPVDMTHGHHQTITGLSTFEVIQEVAMLNNLTGTYDYLYDYLQNRAPQKMNIYAETFKKWADVQIQDGVAFNNWNLMQARNILGIGLILEDNNKYKDNKGREYYSDQVLNKSSERQWSIRKLVNEGYDPEAGLWNESPGYSMGVLSDFTGFVRFFDKHYNLDILPQMPVLSKAVIAIAQYLFPNGFISSFGDSHYRRLTTGGAMDLAANAKKNNKPNLEDSLTRFIKTINDFNIRTGGYGTVTEGRDGARGIGTILSGQRTYTLGETIAAGKIEEYVTPVFYSSKVSFLALRNGLDPTNGLMVAMSGSKGNHMHAGGISMEIFGKGLVLGPESGIGTSYFQQDYAEYYSQFPAHNTVAVDGISNYPVMKSNHGFDLKSSYPKSGVNKGFFTKVSFGDMLFLEPETQSDQDRLISIVRTSDSTGYYVDIFRSKRRDGKDKMHDYFYHNLGQQVTLTDATGEVHDVQPTVKLSFSGGHLFAYDYFYDKKSITISNDINAVFKLSLPNRENIYMNMWMKGSPDREIFTVKAPPSKAFGNNVMITDSIAALPMPTIVARQTGEAWKRPFVAVYEPSSASQPKAIMSIRSFDSAKAGKEFVGLEIDSKLGKQFIFSSTDVRDKVEYNNKSFIGTFAVASETGNAVNYLFLGNGRKISTGLFSIEAKTDSASAALSKEKDGWYITANQPVSITMPADVFENKTTIRLTVNNKSTIVTGKKATIYGKQVVSFIIPALAFTKLEINN